MVIFVMWLGANRIEVAPNFLAYVAAPWCFFDSAFSTFSMAVSCIVFRWKLDWIPGTVCLGYCLLFESGMILEFVYAIVCAYIFCMCLS